MDGWESRLQKPRQNPICRRERKNIERKTDHSAEANRIISINHENMPRVPEERRACALITVPVAPELFKDINGQAEEFQQTLRNEYDV